MRLAERFHVPDREREEDLDELAPRPRPPGRTTLVEQLLAVHEHSLLPELESEPEHHEHGHQSHHLAPGDAHEASAHQHEPRLIEHELVAVHADREHAKDAEHERDAHDHDHELARTADHAEHADHHEDEEAHDRHTKHDKHHRAHRKRRHHLRGERFTHRPHAFFAHRDQYNRPSVRSNPMSKNKRLRKHQIARPGVRVNHRDSFHLAESPAHRYRIVNGHRAETIDQVTSEQIASGRRLALNPKHTRRLLLPDGSHELCVFVWVGSSGSGWMPLKLIHGDHHAIKRAVNHKAAEWSPARVDKKDLHSMKRYVFIDAQADTGDFRQAMAQGDTDRATFIQPRQHASKKHPKGGGNHTADYLEHTDRPDNMGGTRDYINVNMNLPAQHSPPVAVETAVPGDAFFVPTAKTFHREVAIFGLGKSTTRRRQMWVYGYLGKTDASGALVPDPKRRGWVPLRVIKKA